MNIYETIKESLNEGIGTSRFVEVDKKPVEDSDGFMTDYTLYHDTENDKYVTVFGDQDLYKPEDENFDMEFDTEVEAKEWFATYEGFKEAEIKEEDKDAAIKAIKIDLEKLADQDFYHEMKSGWDQEDFKLSDELHKKIQDRINDLKNLGVETSYRLGYPFEYSDELKKEEEERALSNEEYYKLHEDEINALPDKEEFLKEDSFVVDDIPVDQLPTDKDLANRGVCPYCSGPITEEEYKTFGMCKECYDNNVE